MLKKRLWWNKSTSGIATCVDDTEGKINLDRKERIEDTSKKNVILKQNKKTIFDIKIKEQQ